jgi:hypothetical protein
MSPYSYLRPLPMSKWWFNAVRLRRWLSLRCPQLSTILVVPVCCRITLCLALFLFVVGCCCMFCVGPPLAADALGVEVEITSVVVVVINIFDVVGRVVVMCLYIALPVAV